MKKLKKVLIGISIGIMSFPTKIFATVFNANERQYLYGVPIQPMYGVPDEPSKMETLINILKVLAIPLVLIIGLCIYIKKSKASKKEKIFVVVMSIILLVVLGYIYSIRDFIF